MGRVGSPAPSSSPRLIQDSAVKGVEVVGAFQGAAVTHVRVYADACR